MKQCTRCRLRHRVKQQKLRREVLAHYGNACACCGEDTYEFLQMDHKDNDGARHRREIGKALYSWLKRQGYPENFQILCANCNLAKAHYGVCPHQRQAKND